jgi:hypothetical protein
MMRNKRNPWVLLLLLLAGALIGGIAGEFLSQYPYFSWMSFGGTKGYRELTAFSLDPVIDTNIIRFGMSFALRINMGSIIGMLLSIFIYIRI